MKIVEYTNIKRREYRFNLLKIHHIWNMSGDIGKKVYVQIYIHTPGLVRGFDYSCKGALAPSRLEQYPGKYYNMRASFWVASPVALYVDDPTISLPVWQSSKTPFDSSIVAYLVRGGGKVYYNRAEKVLVLYADPMWEVRDEDRIDEWWWPECKIYK